MYLSARKSYEWEQDFISKISSTRGQDELLIGKSAAKVDKKLSIPSAESRVGHLRKIIAEQQAATMISEGVQEEEEDGAADASNLEPKTVKPGGGANLTQFLGPPATTPATKKVEMARTLSKGVVSAAKGEKIKMAKGDLKGSHIHFTLSAYLYLR
jgi:hypothetical protein